MKDKNAEMGSQSEAEIIAHIRNKLQTTETLIEKCYEGQEVSKKFIGKAKKDMADVVKGLSKLEKMNIKKESEPNVSAEALNLVKEAVKRKFQGK